MKKFLPLLACSSLLLINSCQFGLDAITKPKVSPSASSSDVLPMPGATLPQGKATGQPISSGFISSPVSLVFKSVSPESKTGVSTSPFPIAVPSMTPTPSASGGWSYSPYSPTKVFYPSYYPNFEEWIQASTTEATTDGMIGTYKEVFERKIAPVVASVWPDDTEPRLVSAYGYATDTGVNARTTDSYYKPTGWHFIYISAKLRETLNIDASDKETLVTRQKWILRNIVMSKVKVDTNTAIKKVIDAVKDRTFKPDTIYPSSYEQVEILYEIPASTTWDVRLEQDNQKLNWGINFSIYTEPIAMLPGYNPQTSSPIPAPPTPTPWATSTSWEPQPYYSTGYATIDAETGEIISLSRIRKYKQVQPVVVTAVPSPSPWETPTPAPSIPAL